MRRALTLVVVSLCAGVAVAGCSRSRAYELQGQVLAIDAGRREITIKHDDIRGFMPGMTMPFKVRNAKLLEGRTAGDLVKATLVVEDNDAYLSAVEQTGHAAVSAWPPAPVMDVLAEGETVPDVDLTDDTGARRRLSEWRGRPVAVTFIYTRCPLPDFCPRMDRNFAEVQRRVLAEPSMRDHIRLLSISFDPGFDTPPVLASHAQHAGADPRVWRFATGDPDAIAAFASRLGLSVVRDGAATANVVHNLRTAVIGADGRLVTILNGNDWRPEQLLDALERRRE